MGGTVTGLAGSGLALLNNGTDLLQVTASSGTFTFSASVPEGDAFNVTISSQPTKPTQICTVAHGSGTVSGTDVTNVAVSCATNSYTVGGTVMGLVGSGLVLADNGANNPPISKAGPFTFATPVQSGSGYNVAVATQPTNPPQTCTVSNGSGTVGSSNVTNVAVVCEAPLNSVKALSLPLQFATVQMFCSNATEQEAGVSVNSSTGDTEVMFPGEVTEYWSSAGAFIQIEGPPNAFVTGTVTSFVGFPATLTVGQSGVLFASGSVSSGDFTEPPQVAGVGTFEETYTVAAWDSNALLVTFELTATPTGTGPYMGSPWASLVSYSVLVGSSGVVQFQSSVQTSETTCTAATTL